MPLRKIYEEYIIKDQIIRNKKFLFVIPNKEYDRTHILKFLELNEIEVAFTYPKLNNLVKARELIIQEINSCEPEYVLQIDIVFSNEIDIYEETEEIKQKVQKHIEEFVNLHHHDEFSIRDGLGTVEGLIELLQSRKQSFCCVTNHGSIGGWIKQYNRCKNANILPIFGAELYFNDFRDDDPEERKLHRKNHHLVAVAKNEEGFYNLIKIHNDAQLNGFYYSPRCNFESIKKWGKGLIGTSACFPKGTKVFIDNSFKNIEDVNNDIVLSHKSTQNATPTTRKYSGKLKTIKCTGMTSEIVCTNNHKLLVIKRNNRTKKSSKLIQDDIYNSQTDIRKSFIHRKRREFSPIWK